LKANGIEKTLKYKDNSTNMNTDLYNVMQSGKIAFLVRGSEKDLRERLNINIINIDLEQVTYPYTCERKAANTKISMIYEVKKSNVAIRYDNDNDFDLTLTGYKDGVLEGKFSGIVTNSGNKKIQITDGEFKIKLEKKVIQ
jgi:predicted Zn-dependent protease